MLKIFLFSFYPRKKKSLPQKKPQTNLILDDFKFDFDFFKKYLFFFLNKVFNNILIFNKLIILFPKYRFLNTTYFSFLLYYFYYQSYFIYFY